MKIVLSRYANESYNNTMIKLIKHFCPEVIETIDEDGDKVLDLGVVSEDIEEIMIALSISDCFHIMK